MKTSLWPLQVSILKRLKAHAELMKTVTGIYDDVSSARAFPYVSLGEDTATPWGTKTNSGEEVTTTLHVWSTYNGKKEAKQILSFVLESITSEPLPLDGGFFMEYSNLDFMEIFTDPDGQTRHGVVRLRFKIKQ